MPYNPLSPLSALAQAEINIPKDQVAHCYVCGKEFVTYRGVRCVPPDPCLVHTTQDIESIAICNEPYCCRVETMRQDKLANVIIRAEMQYRKNLIKAVPPDSPESPRKESYGSRDRSSADRQD
jgi:hypothetical protein